MNQKNTTVMYNLRDFFNTFRKNIPSEVSTNIVIQGKRFDFAMRAFFDSKHTYSIVIPSHYSGTVYLHNGVKAVKIPASLLFILHSRKVKHQDNKKAFVNRFYQSHFSQLLKLDGSISVNDI